MKNLKKIMIVGFLAIVTLLSSCIKNEVAPEVTALREAQVAMVQAKTAYQNLLNERQTIANELAQSNATFAAAMNDIALQDATAELAVTLAQYDAALLQAEANVEMAQIALEQAVNDLAMYLATAGLEEAAEYLDMYSDAMNDYYGVLYDVLGQEANIASMEAAFAQNDYALIAEMLQRDLDNLTHLLGVWEDVLTAMEAVEADPTSLETEMATVYADVQNLLNEIASQKTEITKDEIDNVAPAYDAWMMAVGGTSWFGDQDFDGVIPTYHDAMDEVKLLNADIDDYNEDIADKTDWGVILAAELADAEATLVTATANYQEKKLLSDATGATLLTALSAKRAAMANLTAAASDNDVEADKLEDAQNVLTAAEADETAAESAVATAESDLDDAKDDEDDAEIDLQQAEDDKEANEPALQADVDAAEADVVLAEAALDAAEAAYDADPTVANLQAVHNAETDLEIAEDDLADAEEALAQLDIDIADAQSSLTDAVNARSEASLALAGAQTDLANAQAAVTAAQAAVDAEIANMVTADATLATFQEAYDDASDAFDEADSAHDDAMDITDDAKDDMDDAQDWVDGVEDDIADNNEDIADLNDDVAMAQAEIDFYTGVMADLQTAYDAADPVALEVAYEIADDANDKLQDAIDANEDLLEAKEFLLDALEDEIDNLDEVTANVEDLIDGIKEDINDLERDLEDNIIDEEEYTAMIEAENQELTRLTNLRDAYMALADEYWALYVAASGS